MKLKIFKIQDQFLLIQNLLFLFKKSEYIFTTYSYIKRTLLTL